MKQQSQHYMPPLIMTRLTIHCLLLSLYIILITMAMSGIIYILLQKCRVLNAINSKKSVNQLEAETILGIQVRDGWEVEEGGFRWQTACDLLYCVVLFVAKTFYLKKLGLLLSIKNQCHSIVLVHAQYTLYICVSHPNLKFQEFFFELRAINFAVF